MDKATELGARQPQFDAALAKVDAQYRASGEPFGTKDSHAALAKAHQQLAQPPVAANPDETFKAHSDCIVAALGVIGAVTHTAQTVTGASAIVHDNAAAATRGGEVSFCRIT